MEESKIQIRTDLALEVKETLDMEKNGDNGEIGGVIFEESFDNVLNIRTTKLEIQSEAGEKKIGKARGVYYTFETVPMSENDGAYHRGISEYLAGYLKSIISRQLTGKEPPYHVLVVGLGNREATPDALGPYVINNLEVTEGYTAAEEDIFAYVSALAPGVMAQTGLETAQILSGVVNATSPDCMIVVDALAARSTTRLANTIQLSDTGIMPGSGVGNHRNAVNRQNMGIPVIAIGVPTVVDAATIVGDAMERFLESSNAHTGMTGMKKALDSFSQAERKQLMWELIPENMSGMYVTPKDVDETVKRISFTLSEAINICMSRN